MKYDAIVVGAGIIGLMTARELLKKGYKVLILDKNKAGYEATWSSGGILSPLYPWREPEAALDLCEWGQQRYPFIANKLYEETGIDSQWIQSGLINLDEEDIPQAKAWSQERNQSLTVLYQEIVHQHEPRLQDVWDKAVYLSNVAHIRPPRLIKALLASIQSLGGEIKEYCEVVQLIIESNQCKGVLIKNEPVYAETVSIATGAWTTKLVDSSDINLNIEPVRGQMILIQAEPGFLKRILLYKSKYLIPRQDGLILAGSTVENVGYDSRTSSEGIAELKDAALFILPELQNTEVINQWAGLRPGTPDGIPYIGQHPTIKNLFINAGHFRNGIQMAPASARLIVDIITQQTPILDPQPYAIMEGDQ